MGSIQFLSLIWHILFDGDNYDEKKRERHYS